MKNIYLVKDYRGAFYSKIENVRGFCSLDLEKIKRIIEKEGFKVRVISFPELAVIDIADSFVIYTSSEDYFGLYKDYIESVVMNLNNSNVLIPKIEFLKAHHNKVAMEMLRNKLLPEQKNIFETEFFGCYEDLKNNNKQSDKWPKVFKLSFGAGAKGVALARNKSEILKLGKTLTKTYFLKDFLYEHVARIRRKDYIKRSLNRNAFIVQNFIPNLSGDYKVLIYGEKYYVLKRENRPNDFRASGSGLFSFNIENKEELNLVLDYANKVFFKLKTPLLSLDIAISNGVPYLIEFQAICFGTLTAEKSNKYYTKKVNSWEESISSCDVEEEFSNTIISYVNGKLGI